MIAYDDTHILGLTAVIIQCIQDIVKYVIPYDNQLTLYFIMLKLFTTTSKEISIIAVDALFNLVQLIETIQDVHYIIIILSILTSLL